MKVQVTMELTRDTIAHTLCSGMEGGIGYWATIVRYDLPPEDADLFTFWKDSSLVEDDGSPTLFRHIHYPMCEEGGGVVLEHEPIRKDDPTNEDGMAESTLNWEAIERGLKVMSKDYPRHFADMVNDEGDAITGDVFVQCAVFGELIFG